MKHGPVLFPPEQRDEIIEARERVVRLITEKNQLLVTIKRSKDPPAELLAEYERASAVVEVWKEILSMRERELGQSSFEKRVEAYPEKNRAEALHLLREWYRQSQLLTATFPYGQEMTPVLRAMPAKDFVELFKRSKEGFRKDHEALGAKYQALLDELMESD
jgi:hypothetical protein